MKRHMRRPNLVPSAQADLRAIYDHIFDQDPTTAALVIERIETVIDSLCVFPQIGKQTTRRHTWVFGGTGKSPFRITYRFTDETVTVLRVFRAQRQDVQF